MADPREPTPTDETIEDEPEPRPSEDRAAGSGDETIEDEPEPGSPPAEDRAAGPGDETIEDEPVPDPPPSEDRAAGPGDDPSVRPVGEAQPQPVRGSEDLLWDGREPLHWRWVGLGLLVMAALHAALVFLVFPFLPAGAMALKIGLGTIPYLAGGLALGALNREPSLLDPLYAAALPAAALSFVVEILRVRASARGDMGATMSEVSWLSVLGPILGYVVLALLGAWIGERVRGRTGPSPKGPSG